MSGCHKGVNSMKKYISILLCYFPFFLATNHLWSHECSPLSHSEEIILEVLENYFSDVSRDSVDIVPMIGGHSNTALKVKTATSDYVLRIRGKEVSGTSLKRELYAMESGMELGIAPKVYYVSADHRAVLMEYIPTDTLSWSDAKHPLNCIAIAHSIYKAHTTKRNPFVEETINETALGVYRAISDIPEIKAELNEAVALMEAYRIELEEIPATKVNIHGDLNPRNIFLTEAGAIFIDWEYAGWEDPFFDLSYCALRFDYIMSEEMLFLSSYLQRFPTEDELRRYFLTKKIHLSQFCIYFHYFSLKFNQEQVLSDPSSPLHDFSYYMRKFSTTDDSDDNLAQFYYDLARICLQLSREL